MPATTPADSQGPAQCLVADAPTGQATPSPHRAYSPIEGLPWLHGQEGLQKDGRGYVYWRGREVEHYSFWREEPDREREAAERLADICRTLEKLGITVHGGTVSQHQLLIGLATSKDPSGPQWAAQLSERQLYSVKRHPDGRVALLFWHTAEDEPPYSRVCAAVCRRDGLQTRQLHILTSAPDPQTSIEVYYALDRQGFAAADFTSDAAAWLAAIHEVGFAPDDVGEFLDTALAQEEVSAEAPQRASQRGS